MITKIGIFIIATYFMFSTWANNVDGNYDKLIAYLLYLIVALLASEKKE